MGRPQRRSNKPRQDRDAAAPQERTGAWRPIDQSNETFENFYKAQGIVPDSEWADFNKAMREPLPTTFRLTSSRSTAHALNDHIKKVYVPYLTGIEFEGTKLAPPKPIEWYPQQLAWQLPVHKAALRKDPHFRKFQHFLVYETDAGNLSRQEAVSMIPPLLLDVQPGMTALDMCAAPGSKSVQILEALHAPSTSSSTPTDPARQGLLIANDSDAKRCHLLVHQSLHRVPGTGMMVTNHDATQLPSLRLLKDGSAADSAGRLKFTVDDERRVAAMAKDRVAKQYDGMLFDRILADVPCSGDGTMRKNLGIWTDWTVGNGIGLHSLQLRILLRGIQLLKPGGRLVYSTCSMNPMENESVISTALSLCPDMSILPVTDELPALKRRPGMTTWRVLDNSLSDAPHPSSAAAASADAPPPPDVDDVVAVEQDNDKGRDGVRKGDKGKKGKKEKKLDSNGRKVWDESLWPRGDEKDKGLEHALRLYPHLQDTGAFFVCVLVKKGGDEPAPAAAAAAPEAEVEAEVKAAASAPASAPAAEKRERAATPTLAEGEPEAKKVRQDGEPEPEAVKPEASSAAPQEAKAAEQKKKEPVLGGGKPFNEEPYIYLPGLEDDQVCLIKDFFGISDAFPFSELLVRNAAGQPLRSIYLTSLLTRKLLLSNAYSRMRLISCGVKLFTRQDSNGQYACKWRLNAEGLDVVRPYLSDKRVIKVGAETLKQVMGAVSVKFEDLTEAGVKERIEATEPGSAVLHVQGAKGSDTEKEEDLFLAFWVSKTSCNLMVEKLEKSALSLRLYAEDVTPHAKGKVPPAPQRKKDGAAASTGDNTPAVTDAEGGDATPAEAQDAVDQEDGDKVMAVEEAAKEETGEASTAA
ncbi:hypothetical protein JCM9279_007672 [Rhodotorula babjevae]